MTDPEGKTRTGLLGNFLPPKHDDTRNVAFCGNCKTLKRISGMFLADGSKAKISDAGPFFCSNPCAYLYRRSREPPDFAKTSRKAEYLHNYNLTHKEQAAARSRKCYLNRTKPRRQEEALTNTKRAGKPRAEVTPRGEEPEPRGITAPTRRPPPSMDSLVGVPCAKFPCLDKHACDPRICTKLSEWLMNQSYPMKAEKGEINDRPGGDIPSVRA
jgi:hypothetical protein